MHPVLWLGAGQRGIDVPERLGVDAVVDGERLALDDFVAGGREDRDPLGLPVVGVEDPRQPDDREDASCS